MLSSFTVIKLTIFTPLTAAVLKGISLIIYRRNAPYYDTEWPEVFIWMVIILCSCFFILATSCIHKQTHTHTHSHAHTHTDARTHTYESSFISWLSVLAIFLGGAGLSPSPCSCSLFFAAFFLSHCWCR